MLQVLSSKTSITTLQAGGKKQPYQLIKLYEVYLNDIWHLSQLGVLEILKENSLECSWSEGNLLANFDFCMTVTRVLLPSLDAWTFH